MELFYTLLGLLMITGQVWGAVILFGGHKSAPKRLRITIGVLLCIMLLAVFGLTME